MPAVAGVLCPRILLPLDVAGVLTVGELRSVLLHEESHWRRADTLRAAAQTAVLAVFFFYPPVWWLVRRLRATAESVCDESVLETGVAPAVYSRALARVVSLNLGHAPELIPTAVCFGRRHGLQSRLDRIENSWRYRVMTKHRLLLSACTLLVIGSFAAPVLVAESGVSAPRRGLLGSDADGVDAFAELDALVGIRSIVTLQLDGVRLQEVFKALEGATSTRFVAQGDLSAKTRVEFAGITVREALERLAIEHNLEYWVTDGWTVRVHKLPSVRSPVTRPRALADITGGVLLAGVGDVTNPSLITGTMVQPTYPSEARVDRVEGRAILQAIIRADGTVGGIEVLGGNEPDEGFAEAAEAAVLKWRYEPATLDGEPVDVFFTVFVEFKLE